MQSALAEAVLDKADRVALSTVSLCELVWLLSKGYRIARSDLIATLEDLLGADKVDVDRPAADAGLAALKAGTDFADGVIALEGLRLGADIFLSFDRKAVRLLQDAGQPAQLLE
jgi:predicted nucleic-acid-binding protein